MSDFHLAIGIFSLAHIAIAGLGVGFMVLTPCAEFLGRTYSSFTQLAHSLTKFTVVTYTVSIVLAVFMLELFIGLYPLTNSWIFNQFRIPIAIALFAFFLQLLCLYAYYHFWDVIRAKSVSLHIFLIGFAVGFILIWVGILDGIGSFMLTPVTEEGGWAKLMNPTWLPLVIHRFFGNLVMAGYVLAGYAALQLGRHADSNHTPYLETMYKTGFTVGLCTLVVQPATGIIYALKIRENQPELSQQLLQGIPLGLVVVQVGLLAFLFWGSYVILQHSHRSSTSPRRSLLLFSFSLIGLIACSAYPFPRQLLTMLLTVFLLWKMSVTVPTLWAKPIPFLTFGRSVRYITIGLGIASIILYLSMGTMRELSRGSDTVYGVLKEHQEIEALPQQLHEGL